jgi:hypothetical protein
MESGLTLKNQKAEKEELTGHAAVFTFRNKTDQDVFKKLLEVQEESVDDFVTKAVYSYIAELLDDRDHIRNPKAESLKGLAFGATADDQSEQPKVGDTKVETLSGSEGEVSTSKYLFVTTIQGKAAKLFGDSMGDSQSFYPVKINGKDAWQIWVNG